MVSRREINLHVRLKRVKDGKTLHKKKASQACGCVQLLLRRQLLRGILQGARFERLVEIERVAYSKDMN